MPNTDNRNENLRAARAARKDEFYTQLDDIAKELKYYKHHFSGKTVLCNCDDPYESNFFKYFALKFNSLGLKRLICTCYDGSPIEGTELNLFEEYKEPVSDRKAYYIDITSIDDVNGDGAVDLQDVEIILRNHKPTLLEGNGDFRSQECIDLLKQADIVVTNPPFSLFREYLAQLVKYNKKFLVIGSQNAITYKEIFPLIKEGKMWLGCVDCVRWFIVPNETDKQFKVDHHGNKIVEGARSRWFTNLDHSKRHETLDLYKTYSEKDNPHYDNYDAIEVGKTSEIPCDYDGVMGVPITFLDKYNPDQFEIIGMAKRGAGDPALKSKVYTKNEYPNYSDLNAGPVLISQDGTLYNTYPRILIRKKQ